MTVPVYAKTSHKSAKLNFRYGPWRYYRKVFSEVAFFSLIERKWEPRVWLATLELKTFFAATVIVLQKRTRDDLSRGTLRIAFACQNNFFEGRSITNAL